MAHQLRIAAAITAESRKVASVALRVRKQQAATRQTGIDWIATGVIAVKFDLNMRRFGRNCDHVLTKRGDQVAQTAACAGLRVSLGACRRLSAHRSAHGARRRDDAFRVFHWSIRITQATVAADSCRSLRHLIASFDQNIITVPSETTHV